MIVIVIVKFLVIVVFVSVVVVSVVIFAVVVVVIGFDCASSVAPEIGRLERVSLFLNHVIDLVY